MRYEEPNMVLLEFDKEDVVTSSAESLTDSTGGNNNEYEMPGW